MRTYRLTLASALLLSLLLHLLFLGGGEISLPDFYTAPDEVLESRQPVHVQRVQLAARPPAKVANKVASGMRMVKISPAPIPESNVSTPAPPTPTQSPPSSQNEAPVPEVTEAASTLPIATPEEIPEAAPVLIPQELAPAFPVQLSARLDASVSGLSATLHQTWIMEGLRYAIDVKGRKFGFSAQVTSEGQISPEGGLSPARSQTLLGGKLQSFTEYANGTLRLGRPTNPRELALPVIPQDFASVPFHLAVTFNGQPQTVFISTGRKVYQARFSLVAEEKLKLPVGTLRTLHLSGERFDPELREMVRAFDVWLAPDFLNYPVKVSGHLSGGEPIEYRVKSLEIEGKLVLGSRKESEVAAPDEAIPEWLQERSRQQSLNNSQ
ncbi:MAG: hypothetical protein K0Q68_2109 [Moraxellaceae bacterium]|jgi:hypothetical protein|nr:hypothetical protein [Moraxellaceae bacterium]